MNYGADAADQIVRYSLDGVEHTLRISGTVAKNLAIFIAAVMKDQKKTRGRTRMERMLRERKPMKFFTVPDEKLKDFAREAKSRGLLYVIIKDKNKKINNEIMVFAEDAAKMNRVLDTLDIDYVKAESGKAEFEPNREKDSISRETHSNEKPSAEKVQEGNIVGKETPEKKEQNQRKTQTVEFPEGSIEFEIGENENVFDIGEIGNGNFTKAQEERNLSGTSLRSRNFSSVGASDQKEKRSSVRQELKEIKQEQAKKRNRTAQRQRNRQNTRTKKKRKAKGR